MKNTKVTKEENKVLSLRKDHSFASLYPFAFKLNLSSILTGKAMMLALSCALAGLAGCDMATGFGGKRQEIQQHEQVAQTDSKKTQKSQAQVAAKSAATLSDAELQIWNDPDFKKRFAESYLSETEIEPRVTMDERETMLKVLDYISDEKMDKAVNLLKKNCGDADSAVFDFTLANIYFQQEKLDLAAEYYKKAVAKFPKFRRAWRNLGLIYVRKSKFGEALPALTKVIELGGGDALTYGLLGYAYSSVGNPLSAESAYRMAVLLDPIMIDWKKGLASCFFRQQRYPEAAALCGHLIEIYPENAELWLLQANAYLRMNKPLKAAENYEFVETLGKSTPESLNMLGDIYVNEELFGQAVKAYVKAMKMKPDGKINRMIRAAKVLTARGALDETATLIKEIEKARGKKLAKNDRKDLLKLKARLAVAQGSGDTEAKVLEEIVEIDPLDGEALILLGQHCGRKGDVDKAVLYYERAANLEKYEADAKIRHAQLLVANGNYREALPLLRRAQQLKPRDNVQKYMEQVERIAKTR